MFLTAIGRINEGIAQAKQAQELDPLSQFMQAVAARPYWLGRRYSEAIAQAGRSLEARFQLQPGSLLARHVLP